MAKVSKGTSVFVVDPDSNDLIEISNVTSVDPGAATAQSTDVQDYQDDTPKPIRNGYDLSDATITLYADPGVPAHKRLHDLSIEEGAEKVAQFAIGWSDGKAKPTVGDNGELSLPGARSFYTFSGWISEFPLDFTDDAVQTKMTVKRVNKGAWTVATTEAA